MAQRFPIANTGRMSTSRASFPASIDAAPVKARGGHAGERGGAGRSRVPIWGLLLIDFLSIQLFLHLGEWFADIPGAKTRRSPFVTLKCRPLVAWREAMNVLR